MEIKLLRHHEIDRQVWDDFMRTSPLGALYGVSAYLDIIRPQWEAVVVQDGEQWLAVMPWFAESRFGLTRMFQPLLCQFQGIYWGPYPSDPYKQYEWKRKVVGMMAEFVNKHCKVFHGNFSPGFDYPLPFHWEGFQLSPRFTYYLNLKDPIPAFSERHQRSIKKNYASAVRLVLNGDGGQFMTALHSNLDKKGVKFSEKQYSNIEQIMKTFIPGSEAYLLECIDQEGNWLSGMLVYAYKGTFTYYLGASSELGRKENSMTWLMNEAIQLALAKGADIFDFEGSMIQNVETFFRGFGAKPKLFFEISKNLKLAKFVR